MSNQRQSPDGPGDDVVSEAYREHAQERTPAHLDHVVLNEAREAVRRRVFSQVSWLRPAAWVTTIGLCLAIVLEVTDLVPQDDVPTEHSEIIERGEAGVKPPTPIEEQQAPRDIRRPPRDAEETVRSESPMPTGVGLDPGEKFEDETSDAFKSDTRRPADAGTPGRSHTMTLRETEEGVPGGDGATAGSISTLSDRIQFADSDIERYCDEEATATPEGWIECILQLQGDGRHEEARLEHDRLHETFPGAEIPPLTAPLPDSP